jgi:hypothetical protein
MTDENFRKGIAEVVQKLPDFLRADLASKDHATRKGAEEVVVATVMLALNEMLASS